MDDTLLRSILDSLSALNANVSGVRADLKVSNEAAHRDRQGFQEEFLRIHERIDKIDARCSTEDLPVAALEKKSTGFWSVVGKNLNPDRVFIVLLLLLLLVALGKMNLP